MKNGDYWPSDITSTDGHEQRTENCILKAYALLGQKVLFIRKIVIFTNFPTLNQTTSHYDHQSMKKRQRI